MLPARQRPESARQRPESARQRRPESAGASGAFAGLSGSLLDGDAALGLGDTHPRALLINGSALESCGSSAAAAARTGYKQFLRRRGNDNPLLTTARCSSTVGRGAVGSAAERPLHSLWQGSRTCAESSSRP